MTETVQIDGFEGIEEIGQGPMNAVYRAVQVSTGRTVTLKVLKPTLSPTSVFAAELEREANVLALLAHPGIEILYDFVKTDSRMYLILEYVDGVNLGEVIAKSKTLSADVVAAVGALIARALAHAHERGVIHRDLKPQNVLLSKSGEVKLIDFGVAESAHDPSNDDDLGPEPTGFGTPAYMAPEQLLGERTDARGDVFSLGVVLYECVSGVRAFERDEKSKGGIHASRRDPPTPLVQRAPDVPRALDRIIMRCLERHPAERYPTMTAVAVALEAFLNENARDADPRALIIRELSRAGVVPPDSVALLAPRVRSKGARGARRAMGGFVALFAIIVIGGGALELSAPNAAHRVHAGEEPLRLVPASPGFLRVLATPWADVYVDGQHVETTPFARPIPLPSGTHYIKLQHPLAPTQERTILLKPGETLTLDVAMDLGRDAGEDNASAASLKGGQGQAGQHQDAGSHTASTSAIE